MGDLFFKCNLEEKIVRLKNETYPVKPAEASSFLLVL